MPESHDEQELKKAYSLHQNGRLNEAAALYRQLIAKNPAHGKSDRSKRQNQGGAENPGSQHADQGELEGRS